MMLEALMQVQQRFPPPGPVPQVAITLISIGLLVALCAVFFGTWRKTRAPFMLGLLAFAAVLLLEALTRVAVVLGLRRGIEVVPELLELVALAVLLYLATR